MSTRSSLWCKPEGYDVPETQSNGDGMKMAGVHAYEDCDLHGWLFIDGSSRTDEWQDFSVALPPEAIEEIVKWHEWRKKLGEIE